MTRDRVTRCSEISGLRLCGIVIEPTVPSVKDSRSSPISGRCSWYTSLPILPTVAEIAASSQMNSATPSRAVSQGMSGAPRPEPGGEAGEQVERAFAPEFHRAERPAELDHLPAGPAVPQPIQVPVEFGGPDRRLEPEGDRAGPAARGCVRTSACRGIPRRARARGPASGSHPVRRCRPGPGRPGRTRCRTGPARWRRSRPTPARGRAGSRAGPGSGPWSSGRSPGSVRRPGPGPAGTRRRAPGSPPRRRAGPGRRRPGPGPARPGSAARPGSGPRRRTARRPPAWSTGDRRWPSRPGARRS